MKTIPSPYTYLKSVNICTYNSDITFIPKISISAADFAIETYFAIRLFLILRKVNKDAVQIESSVDGKLKLAAFTSIMRWNFIRLLVAFGQNVTGLIVSTVNHTVLVNYDEATVQLFFQSFFFVLMSYAVTVDAETVDKYQPDQNGPIYLDFQEHGFSTRKNSISSIENYKVNNAPTKRFSLFEWTNLVLSSYREKAKQKELGEIVEGSSDLNLEETS
ncbi:15714_t:CDS:1 [Acaulospora colombiana]|uniref:15714_t:CDS:1 n=1 Tax=Acaulospora colombiana TaxID=27376 RepID=A0ACA9M7Z5_9GLOM|nr:15714_t:CDS:1 [Acaulospora colombiana]